MADSKIRFALSSQFDGEGFQAATQALKANQKELNSAKAGLGELTNALAGVSPEASNAVSAVKTFTAAFTTGGIIGGAIQLAIQGIALAVEKVSDKMEAAKESAKRYAAILRDDVGKAIDQTSGNFKKVKDEIAEVEKDARDTVAFLNAQSANNLKMEIHRIHVEAVSKMTEGMSESSKKFIEAEEQLAVETAKQAANVEAREREEQIAFRARDNANKVIAAARTALAEAEANRAAAEKNAAEYIKTRNLLLSNLEAIENEYREGRKTEVQILQTRKAFALKLQEVDEQYKEQKELLTTADEALVETKNKLKEADDAYAEANNKVTLALQNTEVAEVEMQDAIRKRKDELDAARIADEEARRQETLDDKARDYEEQQRREELEKKKKEQEIKDFFTQIGNDSATVRDNSARVVDRVNQITNPITPLQPGQHVPTIQEIRDALREQREAQQRFEDEATKNYGTQMQGFIRDMSTMSMDKLNEKYSELLIGMNQLPPEIATKVVNDAAKGMLLDSRQFWLKNFNEVFDWIKRGRDNNNQPKPEGPDLGGIERELVSVNTNLTNCLSLK